MHGQGDELDFRVPLLEGCDQVDTIHLGHGKIGDRKVRAKILHHAQARHSLPCLAYHFKITFRGEKGAESFPNDGMVLYENDPIPRLHTSSRSEAFIKTKAAKFVQKEFLSCKT